jgi:hypothetical protein
MLPPISLCGFSLIRWKRGLHNSYNGHCVTSILRCFIKATAALRASADAELPQQLQPQVECDATAHSFLKDRYRALSCAAAID